MSRVYLFLAVVAIAVIIYALIDCIRTGRHEVRSISKPSWILAIVLLPVIGATLWFFFGRPSYGPPPAGPQRQAPKHPTAPDDDPEFLRNLETRRRQQAKETELKKREAELKAREAQQKEQRKDKDGLKDGQREEQPQPEEQPKNPDA
jgi:hypothetical protein